MTTPVLPTALTTVPAQASPAGPPAEEGVFAGLLAGAAPGELLPGAERGLPELALEPEEPAAAVDPAALLSAQALGLVPPALLAPAPVPGTGGAATPPPELQLSAVAGAPAPAGASPAQIVPPAPAPTADAVPVAGAAPVAGAVPVAVAAPAVASPDRPLAEAAPGPVEPGPADGAAEPRPAPAPAPAPADPVPGAAAAAAPASPAPAAGETVPVEATAVPAAQVQPLAPPPGAGTPAAAAPAAPAALALAAERAPEQVQPAVGELARGLRDVGGGRAGLVVRLDPPELGPVLVRLTVRDGVVDVQLRASEAVAANGLAMATADIRSTLADHGLDLSSFDVQHGELPDGWHGGRGGSPDQGTPGREQGADRSAGASGAGALPGVITDTTADGAPAGAWL